MTYNLRSPNGLLEACKLSRLREWYDREVSKVEEKPIGRLLIHIADKLDFFIQWPKCALLLWHGCDRVALVGARQKYHKYPAVIRLHAKNSQIILDSRPNGPAIASFCLAGGNRPPRFGSS